MPRTEYRKKRAIRFCGDCGYELAADNDGTCPMCPRFEQLRLELAVPRPGDLGAHRAKARDTNVSAAPDEWPPTVAEYRAILDERRVGSASTDQSRGRVIREPVLRQTRVPQPPGAAKAAGDEVLAPPVHPQPPGKEPPSTSPKKGRMAKVGGRRATDISEAPPKRLEAQTVVAVAAKSVPTPRQPARPLMQAAPVRRVVTRSPAGATRPWLVPVAVVAAGALIGIVVPILLSLF